MIALTMFVTDLLTAAKFRRKFETLHTQENLAHERITNFTIDQPFVRVNGNVATVSFVLIKEVAGTPPQKFESHCTDVFIKNGGDWKKLHYRGDNWKLIQ